MDCRTRTGLAGGYKTSTLDVLPPPGSIDWKRGFLDAVIEHLVIPQFAKDYWVKYCHA